MCMLLLTQQLVSSLCYTLEQGQRRGTCRNYQTLMVQLERHRAGPPDTFRAELGSRLYCRMKGNVIIRRHKTETEYNIALAIIDVANCEQMRARPGVESHAPKNRKNNSGARVTLGSLG